MPVAATSPSSPANNGCPEKHSRCCLALTAPANLGVASGLAKAHRLSLPAQVLCWQSVKLAPLGGHVRIRNHPARHCHWHLLALGRAKVGWFHARRSLPNPPDSAHLPIHPSSCSYTIHHLRVASSVLFLYRSAEASSCWRQTLHISSAALSSPEAPSSPPNPRPTRIQDRAGHTSSVSSLAGFPDLSKPRPDTT